MICLFRVQAFIANGWANRVVDPDKYAQCSSGRAEPLHIMNVPQNLDWEKLQEAFTRTDANEMISFSNANIINYFLVRTAIDGMPSSDVKAINTSALNMFRCGHVQDIMIGYDKHIYIQAKCLPEMRKDRIYKVVLCMDANVFDVVGAECGCPAGKGPCGSCKHIAAVCYALEEFSRLGKLAEFATCTDRLQAWNKPRQKKLSIIPVHELNARRCEILQKQSSGKILSTFDPRQPEDRKLCAGAIEKLRCDLLQLNENCAFLDVLIPSVDKITHDHTYALPPVEDRFHDMDTPEEQTNSKEHDNVGTTLNDDNKELTDDDLVTHGLKVTELECLDIEKETRSQYFSKVWHEVRYKRITGSTCGRILCQKKKTASLLVYCLYPKPLLDPLPAPIAWGRQHESTAVKKYLAIKNPPGSCNSVTVEKCGFIIHPKHCWIGASPDGKVKDLNSDQPDGILEIKCPYSKRDVEPEEACKDPTFYCEIQDLRICLKSSHTYYHQVQLQLFAGSDMYSWCDFCIFTCKGLAVTRIFPDEEWQQQRIPELKLYWNNHIKPELVTPRNKPSYYL